MKNDADLLVKTIGQLEEILQLITSHPYPLLNKLDLFPIPICVFTKEGVYLEVNQAYADLMGYPKDELIGSDFSILFPEEGREKAFQAYRNNFRQGVEYSGNIVQIQNKQGSLFPIIFNNVNIANLQGETCRLCVLSDISNLKDVEENLHQTLDALSRQVEKLETQLRSQDTARSALLHDIRRPFHSIMGACSILANPDINEQEEQQWIQTIQEICHKGIAQAEAMQGIQQMERGDYQPVWKTLDLLDLLQQIIDSLHPLLKSKAIEWRLLYNEKPYRPGQHCELQADPVFLEQLFNNLLINAAEASPEHQPVSLQVNDRGEDIRFQIHNCGTVPEAVRSRYFEKYTTENKAKGTGMGTYIAKLIAEAHGGTITMETSEHTGTTLFVSLPKVQSKAQAA